MGGGDCIAHNACQPEAATTERAAASGWPPLTAPVIACRRSVSSGAVAVRLVAPAAAPATS